MQKDGSFPKLQQDIYNVLVTSTMGPFEEISPFQKFNI